MPGQVSEQGSTITISPSGGVSDAGTLPTTAQTVPFQLSPDPKPWNVQDGVNFRSINSSSSFVTLSGVGATDTVTNATFLYLRTNFSATVQLTMNKLGGGSPLVEQIQVNGLLQIEFPQGGELTLLQIEGSGNVEWFVSGLS